MLVENEVVTCLVWIPAVPFSWLDGSHRGAVHREDDSLRATYTKYVLGIPSRYQSHPEFLRFRNHPGMLIDIHETIAPLLKSHNTPFKWGFTVDYGLPTQHFQVVDLKIEREPYVYTLHQFNRDLHKLRVKNALAHVIGG